MFYNYPDHTLVYWRNEQSGQLPNAVKKLFSNSSNFNQEDADLIRGYLKHWTSFKGHYFPKEEDRQALLNQLDQAKSIKDFNQITKQLLAYAIDPF